ncbi:MAG: methyltransferase domain-containing protein [Chloroflexi bacterium]|nr:methyltransferase domain-containing protein [Chloroflexota bacterium]
MNLSKFDDATNALRSERIDFLIEAVGAVAAFDAAERLGALARLQSGPADAVSLARDCAISERGARALIAALAGLGLVEADAGEVFRSAVPGLVELAAIRAPWKLLAEVVRGDPPPATGHASAGAEAFYPDVVQFLATLFAPAAERAADRLGGPSLRVLDIGAGAAPWSRALAARDAECLVTALDLPAVLAVTREAVATAGLGAQFRYRAGDMFAVDWSVGEGYDLAILGNVCHLFDEGANRRLLGRVIDALRPGGELAIVDAIPNEGKDGPRAVVLYALGLLLRTARGQVYPFSTYAEWLHEAGYEAVERFDLNAVGSLTLITGRRPKQTAMQARAARPLNETGDFS